MIGNFVEVERYSSNDREAFISMGDGLSPIRIDIVGGFYSKSILSFFLCTDFIYCPDYKLHVHDIH